MQMKQRRSVGVAFSASVLEDGNRCRGAASDRLPNIYQYKNEQVRSAAETHTTVSNAAEAVCC